MENVESVLYLANKYFIDGLFRKCVQFTEEHLTPANVCRFLPAAEVFDDLREPYVLGAHLKKYPRVLFSCWTVVEESQKKFLNRTDSSTSVASY